jgi:hypothetical protein
MKKVIVLSTSLFTDRILLYSTFSEAIPESLNIEVWATSYPNNKVVYENKNIKFQSFPEVANFRERYNFIRAINNLAWAYYLKAPSILSYMKFNSKYFPFKKRVRHNIINIFSKLIASFKVVGFFEDLLFSILKDQARSAEAYQRLRDSRPDLLVITNPFWTHESAVAIEAKKLGIPIYSLIPSWDNITTKSRFVFKSNFYAVWSELQKEQLIRYYPYTKNLPVFVVGAPQFDVFVNNNYSTSKIEFFKQNHLDPNLPLVLYALGSPNFIKSEFETCRQFLEKSVNSGSIKDFQVLIRPHPNKDSSNSIQELSDLHPNIYVQVTTISGIQVVQRSQTEMDIADWIATFKFSDVLINLSSTCIFDSAYFEKSVININFDHTANRHYNNFIKELNATWEHVRPVFDSNAVYSVNSIDEMCDILNRVLKSPNEKLDNQKLMLQVLCNNLNGQSGKAFINSISKSLDLIYSKNESGEK